MQGQPAEVREALQQAKRAVEPSTAATSLGDRLVDTLTAQSLDLPPQAAKVCSFACIAGQIFAITSYLGWQCASVRCCCSKIPGLWTGFKAQLSNSDIHRRSIQPSFFALCEADCTIQLRCVIMHKWSLWMSQPGSCWSCAWYIQPAYSKLQTRSASL